MTQESKPSIEQLCLLEKKVLWLACWTIHNANHIRPKGDGVKVGGHQASSASLATIMTALYFSVLQPEDRVAVKPHASPVYHAIQYIAGLQTREKLKNFRAFGGAQSYPSRTKDSDEVDFSTGSVGLGVAITAFASIIQDYISEKSWGREINRGRMIALVGDAELDEGNIYECLQEGWKHGLRDTWWIIDYNRQSLDGVVHEGLIDRLENVFRAFGWDVVRIKYGHALEAAFKMPGGNHLRDWINNCPNDVYSALTYDGGEAWRKRLERDIGHKGKISAFLDSFDDKALAALMTDLGGHCMASVTQAFETATQTDKPTVFFAYTIKGAGTPLAGHKDNHSGLMNPTQIRSLAEEHNIAEGEEWEPSSGVMITKKELQSLVKACPFFKVKQRRHIDDRLPGPPPFFLTDRSISTQAAFGKILDDIAKSNLPFAERIITTSPDVTVSTNLGAWVNRRGLFSKDERSDHFRDQKIPSAQKWHFSPSGQHLELGIAEMNLFIALGAAGLSEALFGKRLLPIGTLYDPFINRGLDALNYACYQDARFMLVATPSGITLAPEGGAHQSIGTPLIGMSQPGLTSFEPAFADELAIIMSWGFEHMQAPPGEGGAVYLRLSTRPLEQVGRDSNSLSAHDVIAGAYWLRPPTGNTETIIAYQGCVAPEAISAAGRIAEDRRDVAVLALTSADRLYSNWSECRRSGKATSHVDTLFNSVSEHCTLLTVTDGHPASLAWLGGVSGNRTISLGVEEFGQTGTVSDLYNHYGISADAIVESVNTTVGRPIRHRKANSLKV